MYKYVEHQDLSEFTLYLPAGTCCLLMIFANSFDQDQDPDLDPNRLTLS